MSAWAFGDHLKRFTETIKWRDPWFRRLTPLAKLLWFYLLDNCDHAGVIDLDIDAAAFDVGGRIEEKHLTELQSRLERLPSGKLWIHGFIKFQYGRLSRDCKPHTPVFVALDKHGLNPDEVEQRGGFTNIVDGYVRRKILERDGYTCVYSGRKLESFEAEIDHITPRSKGGTNKPDNLVTIAADLNALKQDLTVIEFCKLANLSYEEVRQRLSKATMIAFQRLQDKDKDQDQDQDQEKDKEEGGAGGNKPSIEGVRLVCAKVGLLESDADWFFNKCEGNGWTNNGKKIKSWPHTIAAWKAINIFPSQKRNINGSHQRLQHPAPEILPIKEL